MRQRSIAGPIVLLLIGALFLWNNLRPDVPLWDVAARWWPFVLILWGFIRLAEVMAWPSRRSAHAFGGWEIALIVIVCIVGSAMFQGHRFGFFMPDRGVQWFGEQFDFPLSAQAPATGIKRIVFDNGRGNVRVNGGDAEQVTITGRKTIRAYNRGEAERTSGNTPLEAVTQGDRLLVRTNYDRAPNNQRVSDDLEVTVPRGVSIEARGRYGDYDITGIGGDVEITSANAGVRLSDIGGNARIELGRSDIVRAVQVKGNVDVQGRGEDLELDTIAGQVTVNGTYSGSLSFKNLAKPLRVDSRNSELRAEAVPGRITMSLSELSAQNLVGPVRVVTKSRDVRMTDFTGELQLETDRGDVELEPGKLPLPKIEARSRAGKIDLALPEKAAFQLDAVAEHGEAVNDYGPGIEKSSDGRTASLKGKVGNGPVIHLTTDRGTLTVRKAGVKSLPITEARF